MTKLLQISKSNIETMVKKGVNVVYSLINSCNHNCRILTLILSLFSYSSLCSGSVTFCQTFDEVITPVDFQMLKADYAKGSPIAGGWGNVNWLKTSPGKIGFGNALNQTTPGASGVVYGTKGNLNPLKGTIEFWWSPGKAALENKQNSFLMSLLDEKGNTAFNSKATGAAALYFRPADRSLVFLITNEGSQQAVAIQNINDISVNHWYHIAITYSPQKVQLFFNGQASQVFQMPFSLSFAGNKIGFGTGFTSGGNSQGLLDGIAISDTVNYTNDRISVPAKQTLPPESKQLNAPDTRGMYPVPKAQSNNHKPTAGNIDKKQFFSRSQVVAIHDNLLSCLISKESGAIIEATLSPKDKTRLIGDIQDIYYVTNSDGEKIISDENDDKVEKSSFDIKAKTLHLVCSNAKLPDLKFTKTYKLVNGLLEKKVAVRSSSKQMILLEVSSSMTPPKLDKTSEEIYGFDTAPGYFPDEHESIFDMENWGPAGSRLFPVFVNKAKGVSIGFYSYQVNGRFSVARENNSWQRQNYRLKSDCLAGDFVGDNRSLEYEFHLRAVKGDALDFYRSYQNLPPYKTLMGDQKDPEWIDRVRYATDCGAFDLIGAWNPGKPLPSKSSTKFFDIGIGKDSRNVAMFTLFGWNQLGVLPSQGRWNTYEPTTKAITAEAVRWSLDYRRKKNRFMCALYDWNLSVDPANEPYCSQKQMLAQGPDKKNVSSHFCGHFPWWPKQDAMPNYLGDAYRMFYLGQVGKLPKSYGVNAYYIDAEVGEGYADWRTHTYFHSYDRNDFKKAYRHASGTELPLIKNSPNTPYVSGGYWEGRGLYAKDMEKRWRAVGMKMLQEKIWQWKHRWSALLVWSRAEVDPYYANYLVGLGFKPHGPGLGQIIKKGAYIQAAFEMRHLKLIDAKFSPCFWRNDKTNVEAYLLSQGQAVYLSAIGHNKREKVTTFSIQREQLPFDINIPLHHWELEVSPANVFPESLLKRYDKIINSDGNIEDRINRLLADKSLIESWLQRKITTLNYRGLVQNKSKLEIPIRTRQAKLTMVVISPLPVLVIAEQGLASQMKVPGTADVKISGIADKTGLTWKISVDSTNSCSLAIVENDDLKIKDVKLNGKIIQTESIELEQQNYQKVNLPGSPDNALNLTINYQRK